MYTSEVYKINYILQNPFSILIAVVNKTQVIEKTPLFIGKTQLKKVIFSGWTTKSVGRVNPHDHQAKNHFFL